MQPILLVINIGSSSIKFAIYEVSKTTLVNSPIFHGQIEPIDAKLIFSVKDKDSQVFFQNNLSIAGLSKDDLHTRQTLVLDYLLDWIDKQLTNCSIVAVGHRVVHGAGYFIEPIIVNENNFKILESLIPLAPLHQPFSIAGIKTITEKIPNVLQVACFDTSFHATQPLLAQTFAIPDTSSAHPIKHYGFHGLSYDYIAQVLPSYLDKTTDKKVLVAHLGNGASLCAMQNRKSVATTMGFSVLDGLPMATRCGDLDPGIILYLLEQEKMSVSAITELLYKKSGLLGVSGISGDIRILLKSNEPKAAFAIDLFVYRTVREIGSMIMALGGLNSIVFTAGIGEHLPIIRQKICQQLSWLGVYLDQQANQKNETKISADQSSISVWIIPTNEELVIARYTWNFWQKSF